MLNVNTLNLSLISYSTRRWTGTSPSSSPHSIFRSVRGLEPATLRLPVQAPTDWARVFVLPLSSDPAESFLLSSVSSRESCRETETGVKLERAYLLLYSSVWSNTDWLNPDHQTDSSKLCYMTMINDHLFGSCMMNVACTVYYLCYYCCISAMSCLSQASDTEKLNSKCSRTATHELSEMGDFIEQKRL